MATNLLLQSTQKFDFKSAQLLKGILMQIWKSANIFVFIWKQYVEDVTIKHLLLLQTWAREISEKFVYKHSEAIEYVEN